MDIVEILGILFGVGCILLLWAAPKSRKKTTSEAEWERRSGQNDWVFRGGTHEGYNTQNSCIHTVRNSWKPGVRIEK